MNSSKTTDMHDRQAGPIVLRPKLKKCGKEDCAECPHGPYFYAVIGPMASKTGARREIYLGQKIDPADLGAKVLPALRPQQAATLKAWIEEQQANARRAQLVKEIDWAQQQLDSHLANAAREEADQRARIYRLEGELAKINARYPIPNPYPKKH